MFHTPLAPDKKRHLVFVYVTQGYAVAKPLAIACGINPKTLSKYTRAAGIQVKPGRGKPKSKLKNHDRWQRAIARGSVSI